MAQPATFVAAMKDFFGFKADPATGKTQTLSEFSMELKTLSPADRLYFMAGLRDNGYPIPEDAT